MCTRAFHDSAPKIIVQGPAHVAFTAPDRSTVDAFWSAAIDAGAAALRPPGLCPEYHADYYGAFVGDPDGVNLEAVCHRRPTSGTAAAD